MKHASYVALKRELETLKCPLSLGEDTWGHSPEAACNKDYSIKEQFEKCCVASLSPTSVAAVVKHFKASISSSNHVGGKPQAARAIL